MHMYMMKCAFMSEMGYWVLCIPHISSVFPDMYKEHTVYILIAIFGMNENIPVICQAVYAELVNFASCGAGSIPNMETHFAI